MAGVRNMNLCSMIETLEDRQLLSASPISLRGGNLTIHGTRGNDTIEFVVVTPTTPDTQQDPQTSTDQQTPQDPLAPTDPETTQDSPAPADTTTPPAEPAPQLKVVFNSGQANAREQTLDMTKVKRILVNAGQGNDKITFDPLFTYGDSQLIGGPGDDIIIGGAGKDKIFGNQGNDSLNGGAGNDWINGGAGDDDLTGNDGQDVIIGESGNDDFVGTDGTREVKDKGAADNGDNVLGAKKRSHRTRVFA
ncbi:MAG: hypothetical protein ACM359_17430 [Bacillota bacterium]